MSAATGFAVERLTRTTGSPTAGDRIPIVDGARRVTFDGVDRAADQVADGLRHLGYSRETASRSSPATASRASS
jgi:non-ribosomal peptide synthetase component E (peptide arylation enzyme)